MSLYSKTDLDRIAKENGFIRDNLEKVIRLSDILRYYSPELLFENEEIVNRIKEHPMAIWKTRKI